MHQHQSHGAIRAVLPPATATATSSEASASFTGDPTFYFPNGAYLSRFYMISSQNSGLTHLDTDLYNRCLLPYNPLSYVNKKLKREEVEKRDPSWVNIVVQKPDYDLELAPCKRQSAIGANCYWVNTNGTFSGLQKYTSNFTAQQNCYCNVYPFWDAVVGCQRCFEMHGGIEGYHWFPETYVNAVAGAYCSQATPSLEFYDFVEAWKKTAREAQVPRTTAQDVLGTSTDASLYYTATAVAKSSKKASPALSLTQSWNLSVTAAIFLVASYIFGVTVSIW